MDFHILVWGGQRNYDGLGDDEVTVVSLEAALGWEGFGF